jgi:hypothetical protein
MKIADSVSTIASLGACGFIAKKVCDAKFSKLDPLGQRVSSNRLITTALKIAALLGDITFCAAFFPLSLYIEIGLSSFLRLGSFVFDVKSAINKTSEKIVESIKKVEVPHELDTPECRELFARTCFLITPPNQRDVKSLRCFLPYP